MRGRQCWRCVGLCPRRGKYFGVCRGPWARVLAAASVAAASTAGWRSSIAGCAVDAHLNPKLTTAEGARRRSRRRSDPRRRSRRPAASRGSSSTERQRRLDSYFCIFFA